MPKVYRSMKEEVDGKPVVEASNKGLGVRVAPGTRPDVFLDEHGNVLEGGGMSVAPKWRDLPPHLVSRRLTSKFPDAIGPLSTRCFTLGDGPFQDGPIADGLDLKFDSKKHGLIIPRSTVPIDQFQADLAATRDLWSIDED